MAVPVLNPPKSILWVDDEGELLEPHRIFLRSKGYTVEWASNADDAVELLRRRPFDILLLDEQMPGKRGLEVYRDVREIAPTIPVVKEDSWQLFGFVSVFEKRLFEKLLTANGVGPALAIGMLSALSAIRLIRAIREKDIPTLQSVPRVGRKKAERLILDLGDKLDGLGETTGTTAAPASAAADDALRALVSLGYSSADADRGVRAALDAGGGGKSAAELIRAALAKLGGR